MVEGRRWRSNWDALGSFWALSGLHKHMEDFCLLGNNRCRSLNSVESVCDASRLRTITVCPALDGSWTVSWGFLHRVM